MQITLLLEVKHQLLIFKKNSAFVHCISSHLIGAPDFVIPTGQWDQGRQARSLIQGKEGKSCRTPNSSRFARDCTSFKTEILTFKETSYGTEQMGQLVMLQENDSDERHNHYRASPTWLLPC